MRSSRPRPTLFDDEPDEQPNPDLRPRHGDDAPWDATQELLGGMATVMWDEHGKKWNARARNCERFASASSPVAAMRAAVELRDNPQPRRERRRLEE